jgi:hypothetical protein
MNSLIKLVDGSSPYYSQVNNALAPMISCQCTAAAQCLDILGVVDRVRGEHKQPEDNIRAACSSREATEYAISQKLNLEAVDHPSEYASVLAYMINQLTYLNVAKAAEFGLNDIYDRIEAGLPVQCSMKYWHATKQIYYYHHLAVVGYLQTDDVRSILVNDPYGDIRSWILGTTKPGATRGYHLEYTQKEWAQCFNGRGILYNNPVGLRTW